MIIDLQQEFARVADLMGAPDTIFVFGSNLAGRHGGGAAAKALADYGAVWGLGEGMQGRSYAIPTKDHVIETLPIEEVARHVRRFIHAAAARPDLTFVVTRIGCGLAGFTDGQIAPMFADAPPNCELPTWWRK